MCACLGGFPQKGLDSPQKALHSVGGAKLLKLALPGGGAWVGAKLVKCGGPLKPRTPGCHTGTAPTLLMRGCSHSRAALRLLRRTPRQCHGHDTPACPSTALSREQQQRAARSPPIRLHPACALLAPRGRAGVQMQLLLCRCAQGAEADGYEPRMMMPSSS